MGKKQQDLGFFLLRQTLLHSLANLTLTFLKALMFFFFVSFWPKNLTVSTNYNEILLSGKEKSILSYRTEQILHERPNREVVKYEEGVRDPFFQITYLGNLMFFCLCSGQFHIPDIQDCQADSGLNLNSDQVELLIYPSWVHRLQKEKLPKLTKYTFVSNLGPLEEL